MRSTILAVLLVILGLSVFYVAWPAWSARQIAHAIEAEDAATLERKIDFPRVRESLKPLVVAEMARSAERIQKDSGSLGAVIAGQIRGNLGGRLAETAIETLLTPTNVIRIVKQGGDFKRAIAGIASKEARRSGSGPTGNAGETTDGTAGQPAPEVEPRRRLGLGNIRSVELKGPLELAIAISRKAEATEPDMIVDMAFTGGDWRIVGLTPRL